MPVYRVLSPLKQLLKICCPALKGLCVCIRGKKVSRDFSSLSPLGSCSPSFLVVLSLAQQQQFKE